MLEPSSIVINQVSEQFGTRSVPSSNGDLIGACWPESTGNSVTPPSYKLPTESRARYPIDSNSGIPRKRFKLSTFLTSQKFDFPSLVCFIVNTTNEIECSLDNRFPSEMCCSCFFTPYSRALETYEALQVLVI
jgi:hypothetical protein